MAENSSRGNPERVSDEPGGGGRSRGWKAKAALTAGVGIPVSLVALANPAAAEPDNYDVDDAQFSTPDFDASQFDVYEAPTVYEDYDRLHDGWEDSIPGVGRDIIDGFAADSIGDALESPEDVGFDVASLERHPLEQLEGPTSTPVQRSGEYYHADEFAAPVLGHEHATPVVERSELGFSSADERMLDERLLRAIGADPATAVTVAPGTQGWQASLDTARVMGELGMAENVETLDRALEDGRVNGALGLEKLSPATAVAIYDRVAVNVAPKSDSLQAKADLMKSLAHEITHVRQFESAEAGDEVEAHSTGNIVFAKTIDNPTQLNQMAMLSGLALGSELYEGWNGLSFPHRTSAVAAEMLRQMPPDLPEIWQAQRPKLESLVVDKTIGEVHIDDHTAPEIISRDRMQKMPDGSVQIDSESDNPTTYSRNDNGSLRVGSLEPETNTYVETDFYDGRVIQETKTDLGSGIVRTKNIPGRWTRTESPDGSASIDIIPKGEPVGYTIWRDAEGKMMISVG